MREFWSWIALAVTGSTLVGLILWHALGRKTPLWLLLSIAPLMAGIMLWRAPDVRSKLRRLGQGAEGEERVGRLLEEQLDDTYWVMHDLAMRYGNVDHFVIGPTGAFAIETKAWKGRVGLGTDGKLMVGRRDEERALAQATRGGIWARKLLATRAPMSGSKPRSPSHTRACPKGRSIVDRCGS